jgi:hypothetical protein
MAKKSQFLAGVRNTLVKHSPGILTGLGIAGMVTSTVMAVKATPKALALIEEEKRRQNKELVEAGHEPTVEKLKVKDVVRVTWKCYIPSVASTAVSAVCLIGANTVNVRRNAALAAAYTLSESALKEYQEKVVETIGEKKERTVRDAIAKDHLEKNPVENTEVILTGKGETLCLDLLSGRYFKSDMEKLKRAENELNRRMKYENYISLNDLYDEIGLSQTRLGDKLGWNIDRGYIEIYFSSQLATDGTPCLTLDFDKAPEYDFATYM